MDKLLSDGDFVQLLRLHAREIINILIKKGISFSLFVDIDQVQFDPILPKNISSTFQPITMFAIDGYTFETLEIDEKNVYFEAGFGLENIGSELTIPLSAIVQMSVDDNILFINQFAHLILDTKEDDIDKSMNIFLSNPENKDLF